MSGVEALDAIAARADAAAAATRGLPWVKDPDDSRRVLASKNGGWDGSTVAMVPLDDFGLVEESVTDFIAHAREDVPTLVAALRQVLVFCDYLDPDGRRAHLGLLTPALVRAAITTALGGKHSNAPAPAPAVPDPWVLNPDSPPDTADYGPTGDPEHERGPDETHCRRCGRLAIDHTPGRYSVHGMCPAVADGPAQDGPRP